MGRFSFILNVIFCGINIDFLILGLQNHWTLPNLLLNGLAASLCGFSAVMTLVNNKR